jgi:hypothetical protein
MRGVRRLPPLRSRSRCALPGPSPCSASAAAGASSSPMKPGGMRLEECQCGASPSTQLKDGGPELMHVQAGVCSACVTVSMPLRCPATASRLHYVQVCSEISHQGRRMPCEIRTAVL